ncbi:MAG: MFS transporter, partial [Chloroflexota bacterium]
LTPTFMYIMLKPLSDDLGWSRTATAGAISAGTLAGGPVSALIGPYADRYGARVLLPIAAVVVSVGLFVMSATQVIWLFYLGFVVARSVAQGCMISVLPTTTMTNWFSAKRGRALGLVNMASPLGSAVLAPVAITLMAVTGTWRSVFGALGLAMLVLLTLPALWLMRRRPEDVGLLPDGERAAEGATSGRRNGTGGGADYTLQQALATPAFWFLGASQSLAILATSSITFHQVAYYTDLGLGVTLASLSITVFGVAGAASNAIWGFLSEKVSERELAIGVLLLGAATTVLLLLVNRAFLALFVSLLLGLAGRGAGGALFSVLIARYYGRSAIGAIAGALTPFQVGALGVGPLVASLTFDLTGSYDLVFKFFVAVFVASAALVYLARQPQRLPAVV